MTAASDWPGPFAAIAKYYVQAGWLGVLPLPPGKKDPVPAGFTGWRHFTIDPTSRDIDKWMRDNPAGNVALRMPRNVLGIDVDAYDGKEGAASLAAAEAKWGPLPPTWRTTSRIGTESGIRLYQVPENMKWPNTVGPGIETIHRGHRYIVAPPSVHPDTGDHYMWVSPTGEPGWEFPSPSSLPWLPDSWVGGLTAGEMRDTATRRSEALPGSSGWLTPGTPCRAVRGQLERLSEALSAQGSRHDNTRDLMLATLYLGQQGHEGVHYALGTMRNHYIAAVEKDRHGSDIEGEWRRMLQGAFEIISAQPREPEECDGEDCGKPKKLEAPPALQGIVITPPSEQQAEEEKTLEDRFFEARPELEHIRQFARARVTSPWAVLGVVLTRVVCQVPPMVVIPPIVAGHASLNLFVGLVAPSGGGKQAAEAVAEDAFIYNGDQEIVPLGSGEGLVKSYATYKKPSGDDPGGLDWKSTSVLFRASEIDTVAALKGRSSATLMPAIRDAWNGDRLGFGYADQEKRILLPAHSYRMGLVVGIQPDRADTLLGEDEAQGGTPQRFLWLPATDDHGYERPEDLPEAPPRRNWVKPDWTFGRFTGGDGRTLLTVPDEVSYIIRMAAIKRNRGDDDALDGHALLARLKVACALGFLHGNPDPTMEDWDLAGLVMAKSDATRAMVLARMEERRRKAQEAKLAFKREETEVVEEAKGSAVKRRIERAVRRHLTSEWITHSALRKKLGSDSRKIFDEVVHDFIADGWMERMVESHAKVPDGITKYRRRPPNREGV